MSAIFDFSRFFQNSSPNCAVTECYDRVVDLKHKIKELDADVASSTRLYQELQMAAKALEKENQQLKVCTQASD